MAGRGGKLTHRSRHCPSRRSLENPPRCECQRVIIGVEMAGGDLHSCAKGQAWARLGVGGVQCAFADDDSGSDELLHLAVVGASLVESGVALKLGPKELADAVLRDGVPEDGAS